MRNIKEKNVLILTGLPFRKQGNQSLIRFVQMFLNKGIGVCMFSAGIDDSGENVLDNDKFHLHRIISLEITFTMFLNRNLVLFKKTKKNKTQNYFDQIKSEYIVPPFGSYNLLNLLNKWTKFLLAVVDNIVLVLYLSIVHSKKLREADVIIGYEIIYTLAARVLSKLFRKKYINKFQGTILKATNRDKLLAIKYFPHNYFTINKSDLCLMVNDGTDGEYYASHKGCENIFFEPHGVSIYKHDSYSGSIVDQLKNDNKFILFNNASGSTWKRTDRIIRGLTKVKKDVLDDLMLITTYFASNRDELIEFIKLIGLENNVIFVEKIDSYESNYIIQESDVVIMTNDLSNLGNPILEAIYYKTPIISIDDGSLEGFLTNELDSILVPLNSNFDKNLALAIEKLYEDKQYYERLKMNLNKNGQVRELGVQQEREFKAIQKLL